MELKNESEASIDIPPHTRLLVHQLAGHKHGKGNLKLGMLKHDSGHLLKPFYPNDVRTERESQFYEQVHKSSASDPVIYELRSFVPKCYGTWIGQVNGSEIKYLRLEDIADNFKVACNLDIKIGIITYEPNATEEKKKSQTEKYPVAKIIGFRIAGMRVFDQCSRNFIVFGRDFGRRQTTATVVDALHAYVNNDASCFALLILSGIIHHLIKLERWFSQQRRFAFYGSSLLFFYEAEISNWLSCFEDLKCHSVFSNNFENPNSVCQTELSKKNAPNFDSILDSQKVARDYLHQIFSKMYLVSDKKDICAVCNLNNVVCGKVQSSYWLIDIRMVDFSHVYPTVDEDSNYLFGLHNLLQSFKDLYDKIWNECSIILTNESKKLSAK